MKPQIQGVNSSNKDITTVRPHVVMVFVVNDLFVLHATKSSCAHFFCCICFFIALVLWTEVPSFGHVLQTLCMFKYGCGENNNSNTLTVSAVLWHCYCNRTCSLFLILGSGGGWRLPRRDSHTGINNCL